MRDGARSAIVLVADGEDTYAAAAGPGADPDRRFRVGSVTKTFTATVVLQLVDEGKVRLDDPVARYLPGLVPPARRITIRQLLAHRSGLVNFTEYGSWLDGAERSSTTGPRNVLRFAVSQGPAFAAGTSWSYSNTNYIALGLVIEEVTGQSYAQELSRRILDPLELEHTELATSRRLPDLRDEGTNPSLPWAAGGIVSNARDIAGFYSALLSGELLSRERLRAMKQTVETSIPVEDGLGIFASRLSCGRFWGHDGGILDYGTMVAASEDGERVAVISVRADGLGRPPPLSELLCPSRDSESPSD